MPNWWQPFTTNQRYFQWWTPCKGLSWATESSQERCWKISTRNAHVQHASGVIKRWKITKSSGILNGDGSKPMKNHIYYPILEINNRSFTSSFGLLSGYQVFWQPNDQWWISPSLIAYLVPNSVPTPPTEISDFAPPAFGPVQWESRAA